jgi:hypothetical protein
MPSEAGQIRLDCVTSVSNIGRRGGNINKNLKTISVKMSIRSCRIKKGGKLGEMFLSVMFFDQFKALGGNQYINTLPESRYAAGRGCLNPVGAGCCDKKGMTHYLDHAF